MTTKRRALFAFLVASCMAGGASPAAWGDCVIKPNPPPLPAGCVDVTPDCICDEQGQNCRWIFHCVLSPSK